MRVLVIFAMGALVGLVIGFLLGALFVSGCGNVLGADGSIGGG
jgi:hypothetical protein